MWALTLVLTLVVTLVVTLVLTLVLTLVVTLLVPLPKILGREFQWVPQNLQTHSQLENVQWIVCIGLMFRMTNTRTLEMTVEPRCMLTAEDSIDYYQQTEI